MIYLLSFFLTHAEHCFFLLQREFFLLLFVGFGTKGEWIGIFYKVLSPVDLNASLLFSRFFVGSFIEPFS